jgi:hypothetical protein
VASSSTGLELRVAGSSVEGKDRGWSTEFDGEEGELSAVRSPGGEPSARPREAGEKRRARERPHGRRLAIRTGRDSQESKPVDNVEGGVEAQFAFHGGVGQALVGERLPPAITVWRPAAVATTPPV